MRLNERGGPGAGGRGGENKKIAYLIDLQTIKVDDMETGLTLATINHDTRIDWLEVTIYAYLRGGERE